MKKYLVLLVFVLIMLNLPCVLASDNLLISAKETEMQEKHVGEIGFRLLNANGIKTRAIFSVDTRRVINATTSFYDRHIVVYRGLYTRCETDDELAAVLGHEIAHSVDSYQGAFRGAAFRVNYYFAPKKYEYKADKRAVDYMVNAGYNPVAMIVMMNKDFGQRRYDWHSSHPLTSRRMMEVYEYIYKKYPEYLANNEYKQNIYYQNFLLTSEENRKMFQEKIKTNSTKKLKYK